MAAKKKGRRGRSAPSAPAATEHGPPPDDPMLRHVSDTGSRDGAPDSVENQARARIDALRRTRGIGIKDDPNKT